MYGNPAMITTINHRGASDDDGEGGRSLRTHILNDDESMNRWMDEGID